MDPMVPGDAPVLQATNSGAGLKVGAVPAMTSGSPPPGQGAPGSGVPRGRRLVYGLIGWLLPLILLLVAEGGVRLRFPYIPPLQAMLPNDVSNFQDDHKVTIFEVDPVRFWRLQPNVNHRVWDCTLVSTNSQGYRLDAPLHRKPENGFRIVCVGDSVTFGYRVPGVSVEKPDAYDPQDKPYPILLRDALQAANPARTVEGIPMAVPGYSSRQGLLWVERDLASLHPNIVTICFGYNDACLHPVSDKQSMPESGAAVLLRGLMASSQLVTRAVIGWRHYKEAFPAQDQPQYSSVARVSTEEFANNILEMARLARTCGAQPLIIGSIYQNAQAVPVQAAMIKMHRDALRVAASAASIPYLEIPELMEQSAPGNVKWFGEMVHPNASGHRLMTQRILEQLRPVLGQSGLTVPAYPVR